MRANKMTDWAMTLQFTVIIPLACATVTDVFAAGPLAPLEQHTRFVLAGLLGGFWVGHFLGYYCIAWTQTHPEWEPP